MGGGGGGGVKETEDEKELARIGRDKFVDYKRIYAGVEDDFFKSVNNLDSESNQAAVAQSGANNVASAASDASQQIASGSAQSGVNPNSGQFKQAITTVGTQEGIDRTANVSGSRQALQDARLQGKQAIIAMGQGQEAQAIQGFGEIASASQNQAINSGINDFQKRQNNIGTAASVIGAGGAIAASRADPYGTRAAGYSFSGDPFETGEG